jgi:hypothetical protein
MLVHLRLNSSMGNVKTLLLSTNVHSLQAGVRRLGCSANIDMVTMHMQPALRALAC